MATPPPGSQSGSFAFTAGPADTAASLSASRRASITTAGDRPLPIAHMDERSRSTNSSFRLPLSVPREEQREGEEEGKHSSASGHSGEQGRLVATRSREETAAAALQRRGEEDDEFSDRLAHSGPHHDLPRSKKDKINPGDDSSYNATDLAVSPTTPGPKKPPYVNVLLLFNRQNIKVTVVPIIGGLISGYTIALVAMYSQLYSNGTNCAEYTTRTGCEAVPFADCYWTSTPGPVGDSGASSSPLSYCGWRRITCRAAYPNDAWMGGGGDTALARQNCLLDSQCTWSYSAAECQNPTGYTTSQLGIFAGSLVLGNMLGAIFGGPIVTSLGTRLTFIVSGLFSTVTSVMGHVDAYTDEFWMLMSSRFTLGIFMGLITVACPLYVHENADPYYKAKTGTMFQVFATIGSFLTAIIGISVGETIQPEAERNAYISARMQAVTAGQTALAVCLVLLGMFSAETKVKFKKGVAGALNQNEYGIRQMWPRMLVVIAMNATFRFTGFNALANFGPKLMASYNLSPFIGVFIILTVNVAGGLLSMPACMFFPARTLFLFGSCFISCMCLFLCGVPVYPGVASETVTNNCAVVGIGLYIFAYEVFVGPSFYVLCQEIFPPSFRPRGNSFAQLWQFIFNLVINVCYPFAVESFSGGPSGNQHKGQSIIFIFFGCLGLLLFVYEFLCLDLWDEAAEAARKATLTGDGAPAANGAGVPASSSEQLAMNANTNLADLVTNSEGVEPVSDGVESAEVDLRV